MTELVGFTRIESSSPRPLPPPETAPASYHRNAAQALPSAGAIRRGRAPERGVSAVSGAAARCPGEDMAAVPIAVSHEAAT